MFSRSRRCFPGSEECSFRSGVCSSGSKGCSSHVEFSARSGGCSHILEDVPPALEYVPLALVDVPPVLKVVPFML